ncbi:MAG: response regulator [Candidatus Pacebacteria bacterium]|nr:response regulator [Candidatus Paceibacterota bacterium]
MSERIFIIEDDANLLYGLQSRFSSEGYEVETSMGEEDGPELLSLIKRGKFDYLVLDVILPKHDGFNLIEEIRSDETIADTPIFIFTDLSEADGKARSEELGINYYFVKSDFDVNEFADKVVRIISNKEKMEEME